MRAPVHERVVVQARLEVPRWRAIGPLDVVCTDAGVRSATLCARAHGRHPSSVVAGDCAAPLARAMLAQALDALRRYFAGDCDAVAAVPLDLAPEVTEFQLRVSRALRQVPPGCTVTYGELALLAGAPGAARAVGGAMRRNPVPIFVPCHRVLAAQGIGGFGAGLACKRQLLALEGWPRADRA